jgi:DNA-binding PadR family transcriptional regulator
MMDPRAPLPLSPQQFHILLSLVDGPGHGYGIIRAVEQRTGGEVTLGTGTLYTALARLLDLGLIAEADKASPRRRYYRLTPQGRSALQAEADRLEDLVRHARRSGLRPSRVRS